MDYNRNEILLQDIKSKTSLQLKINDDSSRVFLKGYFKADSEIHCCRFDKDDVLLALGCSNGQVNVYDLQKSMKYLYKGDKTAFYTYSSTKANSKFPCTSLRWYSSEKNSKMRQVLISANSDGTITYKNVKTDSTLLQFQEEENEVYAIDCSKTHLATCGKDCKVRIYDIEAQQLDQTLQGIQWAQPGHNNRLFCVKIDPNDRNIVLSGGWDQNINIWDMRLSKSIGCIVGPKICGDSIDIREGAILTGANRMNEQLQLWDLGTQKLIENIKWDQKTESAGAYIYGAQFGKSKFPTLGGVAHGTNEIKIFDGTKNGYKAGVSIQGFSKGLYTMDFANTSNKCVFAGGDGVGLMIAIMPFKE